MDLLKAQSLIGIWVSETERKLTPVSADVFVSIPDRDLDQVCCLVLPRSNIRVTRDQGQVS